ncbi:MAG: methyltransferase domain-containing protein [Candidatus Obscuribacterales bacterium]|nr:methyltransferase domain-containing protein [Candidatus Obscuribacterales bacterium]
MLEDSRAMMPPLRITQLLHARWALEALRAAVQLGVFAALAGQAKTAAQLSSELSASREGMQLLLNALVSLDYLQKDGDRYALSEVSRLYLLPGQALFLGDYLADNRVSEAWTKIGDSIRSGKPINNVNQEAKAEEFFPKLAASIFPLNYGTAHIVASELRVDELPAGARVLDVAAGSAVWSLPFAERNKNVEVDALDFPAVLEVAKDFAERHGVAERFSYISGNWSDCRFEDSKYDVVCLGHILHSEGKMRSIDLLKECFRTLKHGGRIVIAEMISDDERVSAPFSQLFALNMFLLTDDGCVFAEGELREMLSDIGFRDVYRPKLQYWGDESPVMIATK